MKYREMFVVVKWAEKCVEIKIKVALSQRLWSKFCCWFFHWLFKCEYLPCNIHKVSGKWNNYSDKHV